MASLDIARHYLATYEDNDLHYLLTEINSFKEALAHIEAIKVLTFPEGLGDTLKITIQSKCGLSGFELQKRLEDYGIYTELADPYNVLLICPLLKEGQTYPVFEIIEKIKSAVYGLPIIEINEELRTGNERISELSIRLSEMEKQSLIEVEIEKASGLVCAETIIPYPPGIPLLLKGERITNGRLSQLNRLLQTGARFQGESSQLKAGYIKVFSAT
jgi:arginine/lysine/ornithine decarboxylase